MTALSMPVHLDEHASHVPLPWRRMGWVTWRQHRVALIGVTALYGGLALLFWIAGLHLHHAYTAAISCHPSSSLACNDLVNSFNGANGFLANGVIPQAVPALIGAFVGAPLLAREFETGTYRFAWTQGFGRLRWTVAKLVSLALVLTAAAGALSAIFSWYYRPYFGPSNQSLSLNAASPLTTLLFDLRGVAFAAWTLAAFAIGCLAGALIRRVVPAMVATLTAYAGLAVATGLYLRSHYLAPIVTSKINVPGSAWVTSQYWLTKAGRPVGLFALGQVLQAGGRQLAGKGGVPKSSASWQYLTHHGYTLWTTYQPASRFWPFQWIEGGWLLALSLLAVAATVWLVRRRPA